MITIRPAMPSDSEELTELLNEIIGIGGTTAIEEPLSPEDFAEYFLSGESHVCCFVAVDGTRALAGFQALEHHPELPADWADIATFARRHPKIPGVGTALFAETRAFAENAKLVAINATIRADNKGGLKFYESLGFRTYAIAKEVPLSSGEKVDRISKRFLLE